MVKRIFKPAPRFTTAQKKKIIEEITTETEMKDVVVEPVKELVLEEPKIKQTPIKIKSNLLKHEDGSILTRNKNIFFKEWIW